MDRTTTMNLSCSTTDGSSDRLLISMLLTTDMQVLIEQDGAQPEVRLHVTWLIMESDTADIRKGITIPGGDMTVMGDMLIKDGHLTTSDTGTDVTHTIVVSHRLMMVIRISLTGLGGVPHHTVTGLHIRTDERTATRGGDHLVAIERQDAIATEGTHDASLVPGTEALGRILHHRDVVTGSDSQDLIDLGWHAIEIDGHDGLRLTASQGDTVLDGLFEQLGIHVPGFRLGIDHDRRGTQILDRVGGGTEGKALHQHFVARSYATSQQSEVDGCRPGGEGYDLPGKHRGAVRLSADILLQVFFKAIDIGSEGNDPIRVERLLDILLFPTSLTHVGQTQIDSICHYMMMFSISESCEIR